MTFQTCSECRSYTKQVAIRFKYNESFKQIGRACPKCKVIIITDKRGFTFIFEDVKT